MGFSRLGEEDYRRLRDSAPVKRRLRLITPDHSRAFGCYLLMLPVWGLAAIYGGYALDRAGLYPGNWFFFLLLFLAILAPLLPVVRAHVHLKRPVLDELAQQHGLDYASHDFEVEAYKEAKPCLFGEGAGDELIDLLAEESGAAAIFRAEIHGKDGAPLFSGLVYTLRRKAGNGLRLVIRPHGAAAGDVALPRTMQPVDLSSDPAFASLFDAWSNRPTDTPALLDDELRRTLADHARQGPVYLFLDRNDVLIAGGGPSGFDPPSGRRERRLRAIFDNAAAAFAVLQALKAKLG